MSTISTILKKYKESLALTSKRQSDLYAKRSENVKKFYDKFFKNLIRQYNPKDPELQKRVKGFYKEYFGKEELTFLAVDGSCDKYQLEEFAIFFAASYGILGKFCPEKQNKLEYIRRELKDDLSMVAYVPIPYAELGEATIEEGFDDNLQFEMLNIHNKLMLLAEVYLIYKEINSSNHPNIILWDQSFSGVMHWTAPNINEIPMIRNRISFEGKPMTYWDALIARAHPFNEDLDIPSIKKGYFNMPNRIVYELINKKDHSLSIKELGQIFGEKEDEVTRVVEQFLMDKDNRKLPWETQTMIDFKREKGEVKLKEEYNDSWDRTVKFASTICEELFANKNVEALLYGGRWMSLTDINFIANTLLRKICEIAWDRKILLIGVVKDSSSKYFMRNYLGTCKIENIYKNYELQDVVNLLWSDRLTFEAALEYDPSLTAPAATIEWDSIFLTVFPGTKRIAQGEKPEVLTRPIPTPERLFVKSMGIYYLLRKKGQTIFNHALFIDRLLVPEYDKEKLGPHLVNPRVDAEQIEIKPFFDIDAKNKNVVYEFITYFLANTVTNKYAEVIGYPEPLHKADWGAKTFNRKMSQSMIRNSAAIVKRSKPWQLSVRARRGAKR